MQCDALQWRRAHFVLRMSPKHVQFIRKTSFDYTLVYFQGFSFVNYTFLAKKNVPDTGFQCGRGTCVKEIFNKTTWCGKNKVEPNEVDWSQKLQDDQ